MGKPVIATNVGGNPELISNGYTGLIVPPKKPDELAKAIIKLLNNKALAHSMGIKAKEVIKKRFSLESNIDQHEKIYNRLVNSQICTG